MKTTKLMPILLVLLAWPVAMAQPTITRQPADISPSLGGNALFSVSASSTNPPITYQWWFKDAAIDPVANPSAAKNPLRLTNISLADAGPYFVIVGDAVGSVTSKVATLTVDPQFTKITTGAIVTNKANSYGVHWGDYDDDGFPDLFVCNGGNEGAEPSFLYRNNRDGTFREATTNEVGALITRRMVGNFAVWWDYDNDGRLDLFACNDGGASTLWHNEGNGRLAEVKVMKGLGTSAWTVSTVDFDNDGWLDLSLGYADRLLRNQSGIGFAAIPAAPTATETQFWSWADYNNDGDLDVYLGAHNNSTLFINHGGVLSRSVSAMATGGGWMGSWGDYNNDGFLDLYAQQLYVNDAHGKLALVPKGPNGGQISAWGDYDNDGYVDLIVTYGQGGADKNRLYHNNGDGTFAQVKTGSLVSDSAKWVGASWCDYDNDGALDLFVSTVANGEDALFHNNGNGNHWLIIKARGTMSNSTGIGATVRVEATIGGKRVQQMRQILGSMADDLRAHFGLGDATKVDLVRIEWPSGNVQELTDVAPDQLIKVTESGGITPVRPSASLNGAVTLSRSSISGATYQWRHDGVELAGQTSRTLALTNLTAEMAGRYSVVATTATTTTTNFVYLLVDTQFTKITEGSVVDPAPEGFGCVWADFNKDGWMDLFVPYGSWNINVSGYNDLFLNNHDGTFLKATTNEVGSIVGDRGSWGMSAAADYDNDGNLDVMVPTAMGGGPFAALYRGHDDGKFDRVLDAGPPVTDRNNWGPPGWGDYDRDGFVDLLLPQAYAPDRVFNALYRSLGNGTFERIQKGDLVTVLFSGVNGGGWSDLDDDGDLDYVIADSSMGPEAFRNDRGGELIWVKDSSLSKASGLGTAMAFADYDNDGRMDVFFCFYNSTSALFHNDGDWKFTRIPLGPGAETNLGIWGDYDNDGNLDLFICRGQWSNTWNLLYRNNGDGTFTQVTTGSPVQDFGIGAVGGWCDYDNDGSLDLYVARPKGQMKLLYHNNGNSNQWLLVKLEGTASNRAAIGAKIHARATISGKAVTQMREISGGNRAQNDPRAHFGLGNATKVTTLRIEWPSGTVQELGNVATKQILTVWEPPVINATLQPDGTCLLNIRAEPNRAWQIEASSDLLEWETLATLSSATLEFEYGDTAADDQNHRFYRLRGE